MIRERLELESPDIRDKANDIIKKQAKNISMKLETMYSFHIKPRPRWMPKFIYNAVIRNTTETTIQHKATKSEK